MKNGLYKCTVKRKYTDYDDVVMGEIVIFVKDSEKSLSLELVSNSVRYDAPQIDALFQYSNTVKMRKPTGSHGYVDWGDNTFTLYPYRVGVPYYFEFME